MRPTVRQTHGFALIDVIFVCGIISILSGIALPRLLLARQSASAASAIGTMRTISSGQLTFALTCGGGFYAPNLTTLGAIPPGGREGFVPPALSTSNAVSRGGYVVKIEAAPFAAAPAGCNGMAAGEGGQGFRATADPMESTNTRFFGTNATGQIFEHDSSFAAVMPDLTAPLVGHVLR